MHVKCHMTDVTREHGQFNFLVSQPQVTPTLSGDCKFEYWSTVVIIVDLTACLFCVGSKWSFIGKSNWIRSLWWKTGWCQGITAMQGEDNKNQEWTTVRDKKEWQKFKSLDLDGINTWTINCGNRQEVSSSTTINPHVLSCILSYLEVILVKSKLRL